MKVVLRSKESSVQVAWLEFLLLIAIVFTRALTVELISRTFLDVKFQNGLAVLHSDMLVLGLWLIFQILARHCPLGWVSLALTVSSRLLTLVCAVDTFLYKTIWKRFDLDDLLTFAGEVGATTDFLQKSAHDPSNWWYFLLVIFSFFSFFLRNASNLGNGSRAHWVGGSGVLLVSISCIPVGAYAMAKPHTVDVLTFQWGYRAPTSIAQSRRDELAGLISNANAGVTCVAGLNLKPNIILVVMESYSAHHSKLVSELNNWTPLIDRLAANQSVWRNFYANGFRTDLGLVALLTGLDPIQSDQRSQALYETSRAPQSLPFRLKRHGYLSRFNSGSSLHFLKANQWLRAIGFEGTSDPNPSSEATANAFIAIPDEELYRQTLEGLHFTGGPTFTVVNTYSSHMPYRHQVTDERGEAAAFAYADQAFASFHNALTIAGFFDRGGILLLTGDHRSMSPLSGDEIRKYGRSAPARVPLMMFSRQIQFDNQTLGVFQQADLAPSLEYLAGERACFERRQRNLFAPSAMGSRSIIHVRGDQGSVVSAFGPLGDASFTLTSDGARLDFGAVVDERTIIEDISLRRLGWPGSGAP